jgi:hypothetical protein
VDRVGYRRRLPGLAAMIDLDGIMERDADEAADDWYLQPAEKDRRALLAYVDELKRDAERYRWCRRRLLVTAVRCRDDAIRMMPLGVASVTSEDYASEVDAAIDAELGRHP